MKTRLLGKTGYEVGEIGLGCWQLGGDFGPVEDEAASAILDAANAAGINFWDTADVYGNGLSERRIGAHVEADQGQGHSLADADLLQPRAVRSAQHLRHDEAERVGLSDQRERRRV